MTYVSDHTIDCEWHVDQYDRDCTCGGVERRRLTGSKQRGIEPDKVEKGADLKAANALTAEQRTLPPGAWDAIAAANDGRGDKMVVTVHRTWRVVEEAEFRAALVDKLRHYKEGRAYAAVTGPGRSGAIAAVYASHYLGIPYVPPQGNFEAFADKGPVMVIDTAMLTGKTIRKLGAKVRKQGCGTMELWLFDEKADGLVKFWYELFP